MDRLLQDPAAQPVDPRKAAKMRRYARRQKTRLAQPRAPESSHPPFRYSEGAPTVRPSPALSETMYGGGLSTLAPLSLEKFGNSADPKTNLWELRGSISPSLGLPSEFLIPMVPACPKAPTMKVRELSLVDQRWAQARFLVRYVQTSTSKGESS